MNRRTGDRRNKKIRVSYFSWIEYIGVMVIMGVLGGLPAILFGAPIFGVWEPYIPWYILYWAVITGIFCGLTVYQKYRAFDMPMRKLGEAAGKVAGGDFSVYLSPMHTADKRDFIDIMFEDFNKMVEELGSIETLKNDFVSNVSHEIKTPLSIIRSYACALKKDTLTKEEHNEYIDTIISAADNLTALVTNILKLSRLENQEILPVTEPYDLCRQLSDIAIALEKPIEAKQIELEVEIDDQLMLHYDPGMIEIVWHNLLANAVKFTPSGGKIRLLQSSDDDFVTVSISDTGCGMDEQIIQHIFDKFFQGDISHAGAGNGLGLALVWRVLEIVGGEISVQSKLGECTIFTVKLAMK